MGFLDRLRTKQPSRSPRGESGRGHVSGFLALEELNVALRGRAGLEVYDRMYRTDPDVRRSVQMVVNPIIGATWSVEPHGGDEAEDEDREVAEFVEWALWEVMRPGLTRHLAQALPVLIRSGFAPFEQVWQTADYNGKDVLVPRTLGLRLPRTIHRFPQDDAGQLIEIEQWTSTGKTIHLPAEDLVYYRLGAEGDNWEGVSLLRPIYKSWFLKDKIERLDAIAIERESTGVPIAYPPASGVTDEQLDDVEEALANLRTNEQGYLLSPGPHAQHAEKGQGWFFDILSHKSNESRSSEPSLNYHSSKIAAGFIAEFMRLGQENVGARATADVQQDPFLAGVEAIAGEIEETLNESLVARLVALNYEVDEPPKLTMSLVDSTSLEQLASYVSKLVEKGVLQSDADLEDYLRERADLPPADPEEREARQEAAKAARQQLIAGGQPEPSSDPPARPGEPPPAKAPAPKSTEPTKPPAPKPQAEQPDRWGRPLRWWEEQLQLETIDTAVSGARERFERAAGPAARDLAAAYASAALRGKQAMPKPGGELAEAIGAELGHLYATGKQTVEVELALQRGVQPEMARAIDDDALAALARRAKLAADSIAARIWQAVSRMVLRHPDDRAAAQAAGEAEAAAALRAEAQLHASAALNEGRSDAAEENADIIAGSRYTSILDNRRCRPCADADDDLLRPLDDPVRLARKPPNPLCEGGDRCRCIEFFQFEAEDGGDTQPEPPPPIEPVPTSPTAADHFEISGGNAGLRATVAEQLDVIASVHRFPAEMPRIPIRIQRLYTERRIRFGEFSWVPLAGEVTDARIRLSSEALGHDPTITSTVHEVGHFLDAFGFGTGPAPEMFDRPERYCSEVAPALAEWRRAVTESNAYRQLVAAGGTPYEVSFRELLARCYEQWIAQHSGDETLAAKIAYRRSDPANGNRNLYWEPDDFAPIARALDRLFASRGLR